MSVSVHNIFLYLKNIKFGKLIIMDIFLILRRNDVFRMVCNKFYIYRE